MEGPAWPLEIPSLKPARIFSSQCRGRGRAVLSSQSRHPVHGAKDLLREVCRSLWNRNLPRSNVLWPLGAEFAVSCFFVDVLWVVGPELCVCASFYSTILAPPLLEFLKTTSILYSKAVSCSTIVLGPRLCYICLFWLRLKTLRFLSDLCANRLGDKELMTA